VGLKMATRHLLFDGSDLKSLSLTGSSWPWETETRPCLSASAAYQSVAWVRRCVDLRANAIAAMPFEIDGGNAEMLVDVLPRLFLLTEIALCLHGSAYWLREKRGRILLVLRWLAPQSISPVFDTQRGLTGFERMTANARLTLKLDDVVYFFEPAVNVEAGPGTPPAMAALGAASLVADAQTYAAGFFKRGAIPAVLLSVEGNPPQEELRRLEDWWKRLLRGVQRAWETVAVRATVKPQVIGVAPGKDLAMTDLLTQARQQIAVAFGVPQTLLEDAANYATAAEHRLSFYEETVIPRCVFYETEINRQLLSQLGLTLRFHPERLEIFQQREAQKAQGLVALVQAGIMTTGEARVQMGLEEPGNNQSGSDNANEETAVIEREAIRAELKRWALKSKRRPDAAFESTIIPPHLRALIDVALETAGVDVWQFLKQQPPARDEAERRLQRELERVLMDHQAAAAEAVRTGQVDALIAALSSSLQAAISPEITRIAYEEVLRQALEVGIAFDPAVVNAAALDWAQRYTFDLVRGICDTTRSLLQQAIGQYIATPGMTEGQLEALIAPAFGPVRAQMIAVTETTRAYSQATSLYQRLLSEMEFETTRVWRTRHDERVCPICGPLENQPEVDWPEGLRSGPPAHVNCRCWTVLEYRRGRR
jgi:HK97 family phage portal protein